MASGLHAQSPGSESCYSLTSLGLFLLFAPNRPPEGLWCTVFQAKRSPSSFHQLLPQAPAREALIPTPQVGDWSPEA